MTSEESNLKATIREASGRIRRRFRTCVDEAAHAAAALAARGIPRGELVRVAARLARWRALSGEELS